MRKILYPLCAVMLVSVMNAGAQDVHFSQFYENAILRNPGLTGIFSGDYKAGVNYRRQWGSISVPFTTMLASAETRIAVNPEIGDFISVGLTATYDKAGSIDFNSFQAYPAVAFNKALGDGHNSYLSAGFAVGYIQRSVDVSKMTFTSQYVNGSYSASNPTGENITISSLKNFDIGAGISFNSSLGENHNFNFYMGASAFHVTRPKQAFKGSELLVHLNTKWQENLGFKWNFDQHFGLLVHANYMHQNPYREFMGGGLLSWRTNTDGANFAIYAGMFYRMNDAYIPTLKLDYRNYSLTMSYDINTSSLRPATNGVGGYEISLFSRGILYKDKPNNMKCPQFEDLNSPTFKD